MPRSRRRSAAHDWDTTSIVPPAVFYHPFPPFFTLSSTNATQRPGPHSAARPRRSTSWRPHRPPSPPPPTDHPSGGFSLRLCLPGSNQTSSSVASSLDEHKRQWPHRPRHGMSQAFPGISLSPLRRARREDAAAHAAAANAGRLSTPSYHNRYHRSCQPRPHAPSHRSNIAPAILGGGPSAGREPPPTQSRPAPSSLRQWTSISLAGQP